METGILFTSQPNLDDEPYPHHSVNDRITQQVQLADKLGFDYAWLAEHHFSNKYGVLPDVFVLAAYLAGVTNAIKIGSAVVVLPLGNPIRVAENANYLDVLSNGRFALGLGSGYREYEFKGLGVDFEARRDVQEEALSILMELFRTGRTSYQGKYFTTSVEGEYEILPPSMQKPHVPVLLAGGTDRSIAVAGRSGFGLMLSAMTSFEELARQVALYRGELAKAPAIARQNPGYGHVNIARFVYVAETDAKAREESHPGLLRHLESFFGQQTSGYLGQVSTGASRSKFLDYEELSKDTIIHGSPATVLAKLRRLRDMTGITSLTITHPVYYGMDGTAAAMERFATQVAPQLKADAAGRMTAAE